MIEQSYAIDVHVLKSAAWGHVCIEQSKCISIRLGFEKRFRNKKRKR